MRTVTNIFIVNLAVADFFVILFCLPPTVVWDVTETWFMGEVMCKVVLYFQVRFNEHLRKKKMKNYFQFENNISFSFIQLDVFFFFLFFSFLMSVSKSHFLYNIGLCFVSCLLRQFFFLSGSKWIWVGQLQKVLMMSLGVLIVIAWWVVAANAGSRKCKIK